MDKHLLSRSMKNFLLRLFLLFSIKYIYGEKILFVWLSEYFVKNDHTRAIFLCYHSISQIQNYNYFNLKYIHKWIIIIRAGFKVEGQWFSFEVDHSTFFGRCTLVKYFHAVKRQNFYKNILLENVVYVASIKGIAPKIKNLFWIYII